MSILYNKKIKYIVLVLSFIFLVFSIYYIKDHVLDIGTEHSHINSDKVLGEQEFILHVNNPTTIYLLHDIKIGSGEVMFKLVKNNNEIIDEYKLKSDKLVRKSFALEKGEYKCLLKRDATENRETFMLYYDKRYVVKEHIKNDSVTNNYY